MQSASFTFKVANPAPKDPLSIFHVGQGFFLAGQRCLLSIPVGPGLTQVLPGAGVANLCFAIELFVKALLFANGVEPPKSHKLDELIRLLPAAELNALRDFYAQQMVQPTFEALVSEVAEFFVKLRYEYRIQHLFIERSRRILVGRGLLRTHFSSNSKSNTVKGVNA